MTRQDGGQPINRPFCEEAEKVSFSSKHDARSSLTGQMWSKSIRVYACPYIKGHYHITKDWAHKRTH